VGIAAAAVVYGLRVPGQTSASSSDVVPSFSFSGLAGANSGAVGLAVFQPGLTNETLDSVAVQTAPVDIASIRSAGAVAPYATFTTSIAAAAAASGEEGSGGTITPLADIVDPQQPFVLYTIVAGDTPSGIAARFGISLRTLLDNNVETDNGSTLLAGQQLLVPRIDGILYKVKQGDTVASILNGYNDVTADEVIAYRPNAISDPNKLVQGSELLLPNATIKPPPPPPPPPPPAPATPAPAAPSSGGGATSGSGPKPGGNGIFHYPLSQWHGVSQVFGSARGSGSYHTGIDLDLWGLSHSPVYAACSGTVVDTEYLTYGYGYHIIVDCGGGYSTLYGHLSQILVTTGQQVTWGTQIGVSGLTGYTTGEHLHFEIRVNNVPVNPANYLDFGYIEPDAYEWLP
jgi:murein DD-endopeptidase MepM/ murein hydrolase activator NlpD